MPVPTWHLGMMAGDAVAIAVKVYAITRIAHAHRSSPRRPRRVAVLVEGANLLPDRLLSPALIEGGLRIDAFLAGGEGRQTGGHAELGDRQSSDHADCHGTFEHAFHARDHVSRVVCGALRGMVN